MSSDGIHLYEFCALICWKSNISVVWIKVKIFTTRQRSCRKVMFSQVSVILFGGCICLDPRSLLEGVYTRGGHVCIHTTRRHGTSEAHPSPSGVPSPGTDLVAATTTHVVGKRAVRMHPTGMHSCQKCLSLRQSALISTYLFFYFLAYFFVKYKLCKYCGLV